MTAPDLPTFLAARWDEQQAVARALVGEPWHAFRQPEWMRSGNAVEDDDVSIHSPSQLIFSAVGLNNTEAIIEHVTVHDPAYVLADLAAKRTVLDHMQACGFSGSHASAGALMEAARLLAQPFKGHPDWDEAWS